MNGWTEVDDGIACEQIHLYSVMTQSGGEMWVLRMKLFLSIWTARKCPRKCKCYFSLLYESCFNTFQDSVEVDSPPKLFGRYQWQWRQSHSISGKEIRMYTGRILGCGKPTGKYCLMGRKRSLWRKSKQKKSPRHIGRELPCTLF